MKLALKARFTNLYNRFVSEPKRDELYRRKHGLPASGQIFTHMTPQELLCLNRVIRARAKGNYTAAEIGSYLGASSVHIANALPLNGKLYCIDTWGNHAMKYVESDTDADERPTYDEFISNTSPYKNKIVMLRGWSYDVVGDLKMVCPQLDFLFIDGDHNYDGVKKDWDLYAPLLKKGSVVAFHDTGWAEGVMQVIKEDVLPKAKQIAAQPNMIVYEIL